MNVNLIQNFDQINVDLKEAYTPIDPLKELNEIAKSKGGICLSDHYLGTQNDLQWKCKEGHEWKAMPSRIKRGSWVSCLRRHSAPFDYGDERTCIESWREVFIRRI